MFITRQKSKGTESAVSIVPPAPIVFSSTVLRQRQASSPSVIPLSAGARRRVLGTIGAVALLCFGLAGSTLQAEDLSSYRGMRLGMDLATAAEVAGTSPASARTLHTRPAVIQEMSWLFYPSSGAVSSKADPVRDGVLSFLDGKLSRIVATYDRYKVEGMTADDMIAGISAVYGPATRPDVEIAHHSIYGEVAQVLARWEDPDVAYNLVETDYSHSFALIMYSKKLDELAQAAIAESLRLDELEAPQRAREEQAVRDRESQLDLEKARSENKPNFRP